MFAWRKRSSKPRCSFICKRSKVLPKRIGCPHRLPQDAGISYSTALFESAQDAAHLSHLRYNGGVTGYLEGLTNETNAFSAELGLVQARLNELLALVQLYEALGGGWQQ